MVDSSLCSYACSCSPLLWTRKNRDILSRPLSISHFRYNRFIYTCAVTPNHMRWDAIPWYLRDKSDVSPPSLPPLIKLVRSAYLMLYFPLAESSNFESWLSYSIHDTLWTYTQLFFSFSFFFFLNKRRRGVKEGVADQFSVWYLVWPAQIWSPKPPD